MGGALPGSACAAHIVDCVRGRHGLALGPYIRKIGRSQRCMQLEPEVFDPLLVRPPALAPEVGPGPSCGSEDATSLVGASGTHGHLGQELERFGHVDAVAALQLVAQRAVSEVLGRDPLLPGGGHGPELDTRPRGEPDVTEVFGDAQRPVCVRLCPRVVTEEALHASEIYARDRFGPGVGERVLARRGGEEGGA